MKYRISGGLAALALSGGLALADSPTSDWAPETFTLSNGMEVVVLPDHRAPVVTHMVWYKVGAADEAAGKSGLAHLFEHVMFKETDDIADGEFTSTVQQLGGQRVERLRRDSVVGRDIETVIATKQVLLRACGNHSDR